MRVIIVHQHDPGAPHVGGIGTFIETFVKYAPEDVKVSLVGITRDPATRPVGRWHQVNLGGKLCEVLPVVEAHPTHRGRVPLSLRFTVALARFRRMIDFRDAILEFHRVEPSLPLRSLPNRKVLFLHGHMQDLYNSKTEVQWGKLPRLYFWVERRAIPMMERIYIVREDAVPFYCTRYPQWRERFGFLPTWVDDAVFSSLAQDERLRLRERFAREHGFHAGSRLLLFVGRFEGQKDPLLLLEAFRQLNGTVGHVVLVMIGTGRLEASIRAFLRTHSLGGVVRLFGSKPQQELAQWMNVADCLVLSSAFEGMPRVVVEALHCGLPVVSTQVGEVPRLIREAGAGRLVSQRTPEALAAAITEVLRQRPSHETCQRQILPYTAAKVLAPIYETYRELAGASP